MIHTKSGGEPKEARSKAAERRLRLGQRPLDEQESIQAQVNEEYTRRTQHAPPGPNASKQERDLWGIIQDEVLREQETAATDAAEQKLDALPREVKALLPDLKKANPEQYPQLARIGEKLQQLTPEQLALYEVIARTLAKDLDQFEKSVDIYIEHCKVFAEHIESAAEQSPRSPTLEDVSRVVWKDFDSSRLLTLGEAEKRQLARELAWKESRAQLGHMLSHPGQTAMGMARSMVRVDELIEAMADDLQAAADGNRNAYSRWASLASAASKDLGWTAGVLGAVAAAIYVGVLFIPGVNVVELATTAFFIGLGAVVLSAAEYELRIRAAGQATTDTTFRGEVDKASAASTNALMGVGLLAFGLALKLIARLPLGGRLKDVGTVIQRATETLAKNSRGSAFLKWRADLLFSLRQKQAGLWAALGQAKKMMHEQAKALETVKTGKALADRLAAGDKALSELTGISKETGKQYQKLAATPEGLAALERMRQELLRAVHDTPKVAEEQVQRAVTRVQALSEALQKARTAEEAQAALAKAEQQQQQAAVEQTVADQQEKTEERLTGDAPDPEMAAKQWLDRLEHSLSNDARKLLPQLRQNRTDAQLQSLLEKEGGKAYLEQEAQLSKAARKAVAKNEPASKATRTAIDVKAEEQARAALDELAEKLSPEAREQMQSMRRNSSSDRTLLQTLQKRGGARFLEEEVKARASKKRAEKAVTAQSSASIEALEARLRESGFLRRQEVVRILTGKGSVADKVSGLRGIIAEELAFEQVQAMYADHPDAVIYRSVRVVRERPGFRTVAEFMADFEAKNHGEGYEGVAFAESGKVYTVSTDIDLLVVETQPGGETARVLYRQEVKSGSADTPNRAQSQLDKAGKMFEQAAAGDHTIRFWRSDNTDITNLLDLASDANAKTEHCGPADSQKKFNKSLGVTSKDLDRLATKLVTEQDKQ